MPYLVPHKYGQLFSLRFQVKKLGKEKGFWTNSARNMRCT